MKTLSIHMSSSVSTRVSTHAPTHTSTHTSTQVISSRYKHEHVQELDIEFYYIDSIIANTGAGPSHEFSRILAGIPDTETAVEIFGELSAENLRTCTPNLHVKFNDKIPLNPRNTSDVIELMRKKFDGADQTVSMCVFSTRTPLVDLVGAVRKHTEFIELDRIKHDVVAIGWKFVGEQTGVGRNPLGVRKLIFTKKQPA
jgi:hypothetical protein